MSHPFWLIVHGDREATFVRVYGTNRVPIKEPIGHYAKLPGLSQPQFVYDLALDQLTDDQRRRLVLHLARTFYYTVADAERWLNAEGVPLLARDATVEIDEPQRWLA